MTRVADVASAQPGILADLPLLSRHMVFRLAPNIDGAHIENVLGSIEAADDLVIALGAPLTAALGVEVPGLRPFPALNAQGVSIPATQQALWCWLRGEDQGELLHRGRKLTQQLATAFEVAEVQDTFQYAGGRDLTGYLDGTENPQGEKAVAAALIAGREVLTGGSFVAVQKWQHNLDRFMAHDQTARDHIIGRRLSDNEEISDAPLFAHVKRAAQESFTPPAFMLRRSMPWSSSEGAGLMFVAFGHSLDAFEAVLRRMAGVEDGIVDGLFQFSKPLSGGYYFCPPRRAGRVLLR